MIDRAPHFLLDGLAGWRSGTQTQIAFDCGCLQLQPVPGAARPITDPAGTLGGLTDPQGIAIDPEDNIFILDAAQCVLKRFDRCSGRFETVPTIGGYGSAPRQLSSPRGLAISCASNIYIADTGNRRIQIFSTNGLALRQIIEPIRVISTRHGIEVRRAVPSIATPPSAPECKPELTFPAGTWLPVDVAVTSNNWTYVVDYDNGLIHVFDPAGCWRTAYSGLSENTPALSKPTRIALDTVGNIYVVQEGKSVIAVLSSDGQRLDDITQPGDATGKICPSAIAIDRHGHLCIGDCYAQQVYFYQPTGNGDWCPQRCYGSVACHASAMIFDATGTLLAVGARGLCEMLAPDAYPLSGTYISAALDSKTYRAVWDRVLIHSNVPPGTAIRVDTFTAESEKPIDEIAAMPASRWATGQIHTTTDSAQWDCLIQGQAGRFLWLKLTLTSDGSASPEISRVKVYYPRASSIKYLPAVYRADAVSGDFLDRFLSIFDSLRRPANGLIRDFAAFLDPKSAPANRGTGATDFLGWLAGWLGMSLKNGWPVERRRALVENAHRLYRLRGTPEGLRLHIHLYAGVEPRILEMFHLRRWLALGESRVGDNTTVFSDTSMNRLQIGPNSKVGGFQLFDFGDPKLDIFNKYAHQFRVVVPRWAGATDADKQALEQIIEMAKPGHTLAEFQWAEPRMRIGVQSLVGVDTVIGKYPIGLIEGRGKLGYDTVLGSPQHDRAGPSMSIGNKSIVGCNSALT